eukprot:scaffold5678_cov394-Prasinococcus_capsulatus_cf.AAC.3
MAWGLRRTCALQWNPCSSASIHCGLELYISKAAPGRMPFARARCDVLDCVRVVHTRATSQRSGPKYPRIAPSRPARKQPQPPLQRGRSLGTASKRVVLQRTDTRDGQTLASQAPGKRGTRQGNRNPGSTRAPSQSMRCTKSAGSAIAKYFPSSLK